MSMSAVSEGQSRPCPCRPCPRDSLSAMSMSAVSEGQSRGRVRAGRVPGTVCRTCPCGPCPRDSLSDMSVADASVEGGRACRVVDVCEGVCELVRGRSLRQVRQLVLCEEPDGADLARLRLRR